MIVVIGALIGSLVAVGSIGFWVAVRMEREELRARANGCNCLHGTLVKFIRDDCPYHHGINEEALKREKERR